MKKIKEKKKQVYSIQVEQAGSGSAQKFRGFRVRFILGSGRENCVQNPILLGSFGSGFRIGSIFARSNHGQITIVVVFKNL